MKFGKPICGNAAEMSVEFQSDAMIIILHLAVSRVFFMVRCLKNNPFESMNSLPPQILVTRLLTTCIHRAALCPASGWSLGPEQFSRQKMCDSSLIWVGFKTCIPCLLCHIGLRLHANCISHSCHCLISP